MTLGRDGIGGYGVKAPKPEPTGFGLNQAMLNTLGSINSKLQELVRRATPVAPEVEPGASFPEYKVDLTSAHENLEITMPHPCYFIQAWCDGTTEGISIKIGRQDREAIPLSRFITIPVFNPNTIYLTNDVRAGRTTITLYFTRAASPFGMYIGGETISRAELAARLGSLVKYDRRGEVIFLSDFEDGLVGWMTDKDGLNAAVDLSIAHAATGVTSAKLTCGSDGLRYAEVSRYISPPVLISPNGIEIRLSFDTNIDYFEASLDWETGAGISCHWGIKYDYTNSKLFVLTAAATWTEVATGLAIIADLDAFVPIKFVINPDTTKLTYERATAGYVEVTVKPYTGYYVAPSVQPMSVLMTGRAYGNAGVNAVCHIDSVIGTQNETI